MKFPFLIRQVRGQSMLPTLKSGKYIFAKRTLNIKKGNVVIANINNREIIKRVSDINKNQLYILGDNQNFSTDSRDFGWLRDNQIIGKVIWPLQK